MLRPIDLAYEHCLWAKRAGLTPRRMILGFDGPMGQPETHWLEAVQALAAIASNDRRAAA